MYNIVISLRNHKLNGVCVRVCVHQVQVVFWYLQCNNLPEAQTSLQHDTDAEDETTHMWDHHQCHGRQEIQILCVCVCSCKKNLCKDYMTKVFIDKMCGLYDSVFVYFWSLFAFSFWNSTCLNLHFYERVLDSCYCLQSTWSICCIFLPSQEHKCSKK